MKNFLIFIISLTMLTSCNMCNKAKEGTKAAINKTGETVGKGASEFVDGMGEGIDKTFQCTVEVTPALSSKGIKTGKFEVGDTSLTTYIIFEKDFKAIVYTKIFDSKGLEYGRSSAEVSGNKGDAQFIDFKFDRRSKIESRSRFTLE